MCPGGCNYSNGICWGCLSGNYDDDDDDDDYKIK